MKFATILTIGVMVCVATATGGQEASIRPRVPVIIEHSPEGYAPCAYGIVHNLDPKGDGFLAVKAGPGLHYERIDKLYNGKKSSSAGTKVCGMQSSTPGPARAIPCATVTSKKTG